MKGKAHGLLPRDPTTTVAVKMLKGEVGLSIIEYPFKISSKKCFVYVAVV